MNSKLLVIGLLFFFAESCTTKYVTTTLDGTKSYDLDGTVIAHHWRLINGNAIIEKPNDSITKVKISKKGNSVVGLVVTDNQFAKSREDSITIIYK